MSGTRLAVNPIHLGLGATALVEPTFTGSMDWYTGCVERHRADGSKQSVVLAAGVGTQHRPR